MDGKPDFSYIGRKRPCGCVIAVCVDWEDDPKGTARNVADFIKSGLYIERIKSDDFASFGFGCKHKSVKKTVPQLDMFDLADRTNV